MGECSRAQTPHPAQEGLEVLGPVDYAHTGPTAAVLQRERGLGGSGRRQRGLGRRWRHPRE
jgi:hypothetical protein